MSGGSNDGRRQQKASSEFPSLKELIKKARHNWSLSLKEATQNDMLIDLTSFNHILLTKETPEFQLNPESKLKVPNFLQKPLEIDRIKRYCLSKNNLKPLEAFVKYRLAVVNAAVNFAIQQKCVRPRESGVGDSDAEEKNLATVECAIQNSGSTTLFSDYDVNLKGPLSDKIEVLDLFQVNMKRTYGEDTSIVFDTNLYPLSSFVSFQSPEELEAFAKHDAIKILCRPVTKKDGEQQQQQFYLHFPRPWAPDPGVSQQRAWSLLRLMHGLTPKELERFEIGMKKVGHLKTEHSLNSFANHWKQAKRLNEITEKKKWESASAFERSRVYLVCLQQTLKRWKQFLEEPSPVTLSKYKQSVAFTQFHAEGSYWTQGSFLHVVGRVQMADDGIILTHDEWIDSLIENFAELFEALKKDMEEEVTQKKKKQQYDAEKFCEDAVIHYSKYWARAINALRYLRPNGHIFHDVSAEDVESAVLNAENHAEYVRKHFRGRKDKDHERHDAVIRLLSDLDVGQCSIRVIRLASLEALIKIMNELYSNQHNQ